MGTGRVNPEGYAWLLEHSDIGAAEHASHLDDDYWADLPNDITDLVMTCMWCASERENLNQ